MTEHIIKIRSLTHLTHDVLRVVTDKPSSYKFSPGQATDVSINKAGWKERLSPFTFTSLPIENYLEFIIKTYPSHQGVTGELLKLRPGDELIVRDVFGTISYQGPGLFIAGGAGVTPFVAILRHLRATGVEEVNTLLCANKTRGDIILEEEFREMLGDRFINVLSGKRTKGYRFGYIDEDILRPLIGPSARYVYLCGPKPMMKSVERVLMYLGIDRRAIIKEEF